MAGASEVWSATLSPERAAVFVSTRMAPAPAAALGGASSSAGVAFSQFHYEHCSLLANLSLISSCKTRSALHSHFSLLRPSPQLLLASLDGASQQHIIVRAERPDEGAHADDSPNPPAQSSPSASKQSLLEALDFSAVRSQEDAQLLDDARSATSVGETMSREQYAALRRKIGGTYRDFFKDSVEVEGEFVDEGWVDKSCRFCKKDTASEPRTVDKFGRYAHITCLEKSKSGNFFTRLFGM